MKYQNHRFTDKNTPVYEEVGDLLLIGTVHTADIKKSPRRKVERFLNEILKSDHLILEGYYHKATKLLQEKGEPNYERTAVNNFQGPVYYLEEGSDFRGIAERYGVRRDLIGLYDLFCDLYDIVSMSHSQDDMLDTMRTDLETKKQIYPGWNEIDSDATLRMVHVTMSNFPENPNLIADIGIMFGSYLGQLREYEILRPKTLEFNATLNGRKTEIVGADHVRCLARCLKGEDVEHPEEWKIFVEGLEPQYKDTIRRIERDIFPGQTPE